MDRLEEIIQNRKTKVTALEREGFSAYPSEVQRTCTNEEAVNNFEELQNQTIFLVGRVTALRDMGKLAFLHVQDGSGKIQFFSKSEIVLDYLKKYLDLGDFVEGKGKLFLTKSGEKTLEVEELRVIAKSLRPIPSEHFGIEDEETRLRKRYLDILLDPKSKEIFQKKAVFWQSFREFLLQRGFLEMYMPVLEEATGGAEAEPFITHHNALDQDFYLRISLELPLKKMLVAGYEKVFEIGRVFRNEGISPTHLQDFTHFEFYWAYSSFDDLLKMWQEMYQYVIKKTFGTLTIETGGIVCDWGGEWERVNYLELFQKHTGIDLNTATDDELRAYCDSHSIVYEDFVRRGRLIDLIFKKIRVTLPKEKPIFLINQPIELEPLAKRVPGKPKLVQRAQLIAYGSEQGKGFGELNDPIDQRGRFEEQARLRAAGDVEAQMMNEGYVEAMEYGMPPCSGFGVGDRLFSSLLGLPIRETVVFPPMRSEASEIDKSKTTKFAAAVVNVSAGLEKWQELNTIGHLSAAFGARIGKRLFTHDEIITQDNERIKLNVKHAILIKQADSIKDLIQLAKDAKAQGLEVAEFTREMMETTDDRKVVEWTKEKKLEEVEFLGVLVFGEKKAVESLTKDFELYS